MRAWGQAVRRVLPAVLVAMFLVVPGLWATQKRHPKPTKHYVAKHHLRQVPSRRARSQAPKRKLQHRVPKRRAKSTRHHVTHRRRYHRRRYRRRRIRIPTRPTADRIQQIQQALSRSGYYQGDPTGRWDAATVSAMKSFQQAHGITPTGKIDAPSLQQLGLGSDIAGLAPPRPVVSTDPSNSGKGGKGAGGR